MAKPLVKPASPSKKDSGKLNEEKKHLYELEERYRNMIRTYKEVQANQHQKPMARQPEKIVTQEKMAIGSGGEDLELIENIKKKRRRSSLAKAMGMKPVLQENIAANEKDQDKPGRKKQTKASGANDLADKEKTLQSKVGEDEDTSGVQSVEIAEGTTVDEDGDDVEFSFVLPQPQQLRNIAKLYVS